MFRRKLSAVLLALAVAGGASACDTDETGDAEGGPGQSTEEDPTLDQPEGGESTDDGTDGGTPTSGATDNGSGTGAGRGDG